MALGGGSGRPGVGPDRTERVLVRSTGLVGLWRGLAWAVRKGSPPAGAVCAAWRGVPESVGTYTNYLGGAPESQYFYGVQLRLLGRMGCVLPE